VDADDAGGRAPEESTVPRTRSGPAPPRDQTRMWNTGHADTCGTVIR
jgi:hypothetical protein